MAEFPLFNSFPPEIHSLILDGCPPNDLTCLRLTCKYLYSLPPSHEPISLKNTDIDMLCGHPEISSKTDYQTLWAHRRECHKLSYDEHCKQRERDGKRILDMKGCTTRNWNIHCECFTNKSRLHYRLRTWMPKGLNYCGGCDAFTRRKKQHHGRCFHGRGKYRRYEGNFWTHRSRGGAFGRKLWKRWFNNKAMNSFERRLRQDFPTPRKGSNRYSMRELKPKDVNTMIARTHNAYV